MQIRFIALAGLIIGFFVAWTGFRIYRKAAADTTSSDSKITSSFEKSLNEFSRYPSKYIALMSVFGLILVTIFVSNVSVFGVSIKTEYLIGVYILMSFALQVDSRVAIGFALFLLSLCPFLLIFDYGKTAENVAVYVWYFLAVGVILQVFEYVRESRTGEEIASEEESPIELRRVALERRKTAESRQVWQIVALVTFVTVLTVAGGVIWHAGVVSKIPALIGLSAEKPKTNTHKTKPTVKKAPPKKEPEQQAPAATVAPAPAVSVIVLNGSGVDGAATSMADVLNAAGKNVIGADNAPQEYPNTMIYYRTGFDQQAQAVAGDIASYYPATIEEGSVSGFDADVIVVLGMDGIQ